MRNLILLALLLLAALSLACGGDDDDGDEPEATTAPAETTASSSPSPGQDGSHLQTISSENFTPAVTVDVSAGWVVEIDTGGIFVLRHDQNDEGPLGYVGMSYPRKVWSYDGLIQEDLPDDLVAWVKAHPRLTIRGEEPITIGGLSGVQLEIGADEGEDFKFMDDDEGTFDVHYSDHFILNIFETDEGPLAMFVGAEQATRFEAFAQVAQPVVQTMEFAE